jgi:hypothetical protein
MNKQDDKPGRETDKFSDSNELFESIFRKAMTGERKQKTEKLKLEKDRHPNQAPPKAEIPSPSRRKPSAVVKKPSNQISKPTPEPKKVKREAAAAGISHPPMAKAKSEKDSSRLKVSVFVILLVVFCGVLVSYFGIFNLSTIANVLGLGEKKVAQTPQKKVARTVPEEPQTAPPKKQVEQEVPPANKTETEAPVVPTISEPPPVAVEKEETPESDQLRKETMGPAILTTITEIRPEGQIPGKDTHAASQAQSTKDETRTSAAQTLNDTKPDQKEPVFSHVTTGQYPYSIYLGSYRTDTRLEKAISIYQEKGLTPYWVKVDLGDKGLWFRLFAGYFRSKEAVEGYIKANRIAEAEPHHTKYAVFLGKYQSADELNKEREKLLSLGFCPYSIKETNDESLLYSGAFYRKDFAEKEQRELISKGIKAELVER